MHTLLKSGRYLVRASLFIHGCWSSSTYESTDNLGCQHCSTNATGTHGTIDSNKYSAWMKASLGKRGTMHSWTLAM